MLPWILLAAGLVAGDAVGKASAKKQLEKPVYRAVLTRKGGAVETITGSMLQAWGAAVEREVTLRASGDPVVAMVLYANTGQVVRSWSPPAAMQGWF